MPASKISDDALLAKIAEVFRLHGYEGASIRLLSQAAGLERASLYHRFPGGKEEMAAAMVDRIGEWLEHNVFRVLGTKERPAEKLRRVAGNLRAFYRRGTLWCVLDSMTLGGGTEEIRQRIRAAYSAWLRAFERAAREAGLPDSLARSHARQALIEIEGSLVVARVTGDPHPFLQVTRNLPVLLTARSRAHVKKR